MWNPIIRWPFALRTSLDAASATIATVTAERDSLQEKLRTREHSYYQLEHKYAILAGPCPAISPEGLSCDYYLGHQEQLIPHQHTTNEMEPDGGYTSNLKVWTI